MVTMWDQDPNQTSPEPTSLSDKESRRAEELMSTSIPVSTPQRGGGARDIVDQTDFSFEKSGCSLS